MQSARFVAEEKLKRNSRHSGESRLAHDGPAPQMRCMVHPNRNTNGVRGEKLRLFLLALGILLMLAAPVVGILPGPGGVIVLAGGLALTLKNSKGAKRLYVRFKQRWPKYGHWADWSLRRRSHFRRLRRKNRRDQAND